MANTIEGGAFLVGGSWVNADGKPLSKAQIEAVKALHGDNEAARGDQERERVALEAQRNPTAQAIAAAMAPKGKKAGAE